MKFPYFSLSSISFGNDFHINLLYVCSHQPMIGSARYIFTFFIQYSSQKILADKSA